MIILSNRVDQHKELKQECEAGLVVLLNHPRVKTRSDEGGTYTHLWFGCEQQADLLRVTLWSRY